jgi:hypothetical protein
MRSYLDTLHGLTGKPIFVSEIYMAAMQNRSGNRNSYGGFPVVRTQTERAAATRRTLASLVQLPYVVGADWFQYFDEPRHGRQDGENFNFGLVDIHNEPYEQLTTALAELDVNDLKTHLTAAPMDASAGVPRAPREPFVSVSNYQALLHWDRQRGFVKPVSDHPMADLYLCWDPRAIYLGLYAIDVIEEDYYRDKSVPKEDRAQWIVRIDKGEPVRARMGAGREAILNDPTVRFASLSGLNLNVRNIALLEFPASRFGKRRLRRGDRIELESTFLTHQQAYRVQWQGTFHLR